MDGHRLCRSPQPSSEHLHLDDGEHCFARMLVPVVDIIEWVMITGLTILLILRLQVPHRQHGPHNRREPGQRGLRVRPDQHHLSHLLEGHPRGGHRDVHHLQCKYACHWPVVMKANRQLRYFIQSAQ